MTSNTKQSGLGDHFLAGGYLIGDDVTDVAIATPIKTLDVTPITKSAHSRLYGMRDGSMSVTTVMDPAAGLEHQALSGLPTADVIEMYLRGQGLGSPAACIVARQLDYDGTRANDGMLTFKTEWQGDGYGLEWGLQVTPGLRTDTSDTTGTDLDNGAATLWGAQAYLQAISVTGTSGTVTIQHAPDNSTYITLLAFSAVASAPAAQRAATFTGPFTATNASPCVFTVPGSSFSNGTPVALSVTANPGQQIPAGFSAATEYFVVSASGSTFELSASSGGSAINSTSTGAGTVTQVVQRYVRVVTTGTFSSFEFVAALNRNPVSGVSF